MKRSGDDLLANDHKKLKKIKDEDESAVVENTNSVLTDENLLYEILKHADARTLGAAACINKQWNKTVRDERLWELICSRQWANIGCSVQQLRSVVLALGGFRRLHAHYLWPLAKPAEEKVRSSVIRSDWPCDSAPVVKVKSGVVAPRPRWGKDEVNLSLSLLSIRYFEKMKFSNRGK
ncbi:F-box protein GID2 [Heracleum sosnowskyi]|uniref:F-box protein GID2 n=1 Tax=Heracleum sosnowskyi TaxID=360622 RepID=A0AAD8N1L3_9APIA|nr:F-box protein GID2 [Heracleum sosnowskyi]